MILFDDKYYVQVGGVAMGSKFGPSYACIFVGYQEHLISQQYEGPFPQLIKPYIDDIVGATSLPLHQLQNFIDFICYFIWPSSSHSISQRLNCHSSTSCCLFQMIPSPHPSIIRLQTLKVFLTTPHHIPSKPKTLFLFLSFYVFGSSALRILILERRQKK